MNWRDQFDKLQSRADSATEPADFGQRAELLRALTRLHQELQKDIRRLVTSNPSCLSYTNNSKSVLSADSSDPRTWETSALAQMILLSQSDDSILHDPSLRTFLQAIDTVCSEDRVILMDACTAVCKQASALGGVLIQLPLEEEAYIAELRSVIGLDETARQYVHQQTEEIT